MRARGFIIAGVLGLTLSGCQGTSGTPTSDSGMSASALAATPPSGVVLPRRDLTPGLADPQATTDIVCHRSTKTVRNVPLSVHDQVYAEYGITHHITGEYEVDHLIPLEVGGSNDIKNLWPEPANPVPGFHQKDVLENALHAKVCDGSVNLSDAQTQIATNWYAAYVRYCGTDGSGCDKYKYQGNGS